MKDLTPRKGHESQAKHPYGKPLTEEQWASESARSCLLLLVVYSVCVGGFLIWLVWLLEQ